MTSVFDLYGYGVPPYDGDSIDASTADVAALYDQKQRYGNSLFGRLDNWLRSKQSQPNQLASDASLWDQAAEAGNRLAHLPVDMLIAGSRTANNWAGSPQFPERVEPGDMLAPLGLGAMAGLGGALKGAALQGRMMPDTIPASYFDDIVPQRQAGRSVLPGVELFADQSRASLPGLVVGAVDEPRGAVGSAGGGTNAGRAAAMKEMLDAPAYQANSLSPSQQPYAQMVDGQTGRMHGVGGQPALAGRSSIADDQLLGPYVRSLGLNPDGQLTPIIARAARDYDTSPHESYLGLRMTNDQLEVGSKAPNSRQWYQDYIEGDPEMGRSMFPDHGHDLGGTSAVRLPLTAKGVADARKEIKTYPGRNVSVLRSDERWNGADPLEWVMPNAEVIGTVARNKLRDELFSDTTRASLPGLFAGAVDEPRGITAYHGSPHDFDRFDMSKIGTGEGAQAYGHGLYFAENESVARSYKDELGGGGSKIVADSPISGELRAWLDKYPDVDVARMMLEMRRDKPGVSELIDEINRLSGARAVPSNGHLYEVRINADPEDFLDWDKPLSQQSENALAAIQNVLPEYPRRILGPTGRIEEIGKGLPVPDTTVEQFMTTLPSKEAATALREAGIPGIRYLDQGSRFAGDGSRNYVLFRDDIIEIVKKYGIAAAASMYGMSAVDEAMASEGP